MMIFYFLPKKTVYHMICCNPMWFVEEDNWYIAYLRHVSTVILFTGTLLVISVHHPLYLLHLLNEALSSGLMLFRLFFMDQLLHYLLFFAGCFGKPYLELLMKLNWSLSTGFWYNNQPSSILTHAFTMSLKILFVLEYQ